MEILEQLCSIMKAVEQKYVIIQMMYGKALDRRPLYSFPFLEGSGQSIDE